MVIKLHFYKVLTLFTVLNLGCVLPILAQRGHAFDSLSKVLLISTDIRNRAETLIELSKELEGEFPQESLKYASQALKLAEENHLTSMKINSLIQLGTVNVRIGEYETAFKYAEGAYELAKSSNYKKEMARSNSVLAMIYYEIGDYEKSAKSDFENLTYYEQIKDSKQVGLTLGNIGIDFISQNNYEKGLEYLKRSLSIANKTNDYHGMAYQYNNIAGVYSEYYKDHRIALGYYTEALKINKRLNDNRQEGIYLMNIGNCYNKLKEDNKVLPNYFTALDLFKKQNNLALQAECFTLIGEYYHRLKLYPLNLKYADSAVTLSLLTNNTEQTQLAAGLLHKIYLSQNDIENAYHFAMIENAAKDSLFFLQNKKEVYKLEFQYYFEKADKERQLARQKKENIFKIAILSLISGLVIIILLFSRYRFKTRSVYLEKQSMEKELEFKNKELTINLLSLIKKNEMLADISKKLSDLGNDTRKDETKEAIMQINKDLRNSTDDKMMKEFSLRFQEVHSGFYEALLKKFPDLTQNELKLCAFLRLNMSTKDISELTGQRGLTIDHARYRLRKKLGISNSEVNLVTFLSQI